MNEFEIKIDDIINLKIIDNKKIMYKKIKYICIIEIF